MKPIRISLVSYLNTIPFLHGIEQSQHLSGIELFLDVPADCVKRFANGEADIALVPVGALNELNDFRIITNTCIGALGPVKSVILASQVPISEVRTIILDYQSRTSNVLTRILAAELWKISPGWIRGSEGYLKTIKSNTGGVVIGDRALKSSAEFRYATDLSAEWYKLTRMPFVFAVWIARNNVPTETIDFFEAALKFGLDEKREAVSCYAQRMDQNEEDALDYLTNFIDYDFDQAKQNALVRFREYQMKM